MQKIWIGAFALAASVAGSALAESPGEFRGGARLVTAVSTPLEARVAGVDWRCEADACLGQARRYNTLDSVRRECGRFVAAVGPVSAYASRGERLGRNALADCNASARRIQRASAE
jgi:hypothetical protein